LALFRKSGGFEKYWGFSENQADLQKIVALQKNRRTIESLRVLKSLRLHHHAQSVGGIIVLGLHQIDDITDGHASYRLHPFVAQHPPAEDLLRPLLPELLLCFRDELQPLGQARCLFKLHLWYLHKGPAQLQVQRRDRTSGL
jgi:hypothetical protein